MNSRETTKNPNKQEIQTGCILQGSYYCTKKRAKFKLVWPHAEVHVCRTEVIVNRTKTVRESLGAAKICQTSFYSVQSIKSILADTLNSCNKHG